MNDELKDYDMEQLSKAMLKARQAFEQYLDDEGLDATHFDLKLTGYVLTRDFEKWKKIDMDFWLQLENEDDTNE